MDQCRGCGKTVKGCAGECDRCFPPAPRTRRPAVAAPKDYLCIGAVVFADENGKLVDLCGPPRVNVLRALFRRQPLPYGLTAVATNPRRQVAWESINWDTAGIAVTGAAECTACRRSFTEEPSEDGYCPSCALPFSTSEK
jgi:hypothetical protein